MRRNQGWRLIPEKRVIGDLFVIPIHLDPVEYDGLPLDMVPIANAFHANAISASVTLSSPFSLAVGSVVGADFERRLKAKHIRSGVHIPARNQEEQDQIDVNFAQTLEEQAAILTTEEGDEQTYEDAVAFLEGISYQKIVAQAADELRYQAAVAFWTTFEVLARDLTVAYLNRNPRAAVSLTKERRFELKPSLDDLAASDFDLSKSMGDLFVSKYDFSDYLNIKATFDALLGSGNPMQQEPYNTSLLQLNRKRNLIVHRGGMIDRKYLHLTGEPVELLGSRVSLSPMQIINYAGNMQLVGSALLKCFCN